MSFYSLFFLWQKYVTTILLDRRGHPKMLSVGDRARLDHDRRGFLEKGSEKLRDFATWVNNLGRTPPRADLSSWKSTSYCCCLIPICLFREWRPTMKEVEVYFKVFGCFGERERAIKGGSRVKSSFGNFSLKHSKARDVHAVSSDYAPYDCEKRLLKRTQSRGRLSA